MAIVRGRGCQTRQFSRRFCEPMHINVPLWRAESFVDSRNRISLDSVCFLLVTLSYGFHFFDVVSDRHFRFLLLLFFNPKDVCFVELASQRIEETPALRSFHKEQKLRH